MSYNISALISKFKSDSELRYNNKHIKFGMTKPLSKMWPVTVCAPQLMLLSSTSGNNTEFVTRLLDIITHVTAVSSDSY